MDGIDYFPMELQAKLPTAFTCLLISLNAKWLLLEFRKSWSHLVSLVGNLRHPNMQPPHTKEEETERLNALLQKVSLEHFDYIMTMFGRFGVFPLLYWTRLCFSSESPGPLLLPHATIFVTYAIIMMFLHIQMLQHTPNRQVYFANAVQLAWLVRLMALSEPSVWVLNTPLRIAFRVLISFIDTDIARMTAHSFAMTAMSCYKASQILPTVLPVSDTSDANFKAIYFELCTGGFVWMISYLSAWRLQLLAQKTLDAKDAQLEASALDSMFSVLCDAKATLGPDLTIRTSSLSLCHLFGVSSPQQLEGRFLTDFLAEGDKPRFDAFMNRPLSHPELAPMTPATLHVDVCCNSMQRPVQLFDVLARSHSDLYHFLGLRVDVDEAQTHTWHSAGQDTEETTRDLPPEVGTALHRHYTSFTTRKEDGADSISDNSGHLAELAQLLQRCPSLLGVNVDDAADKSNLWGEAQSGPSAISDREQLTELGQLLQQLYIPGVNTGDAAGQSTLWEARSVSSGMSSEERLTGLGQVLQQPHIRGVKAGDAAGKSSLWEARSVSSEMSSEERLTGLGQVLQQLYIRGVKAGDAASQSNILEARSSSSATSGEELHRACAYLRSAADRTHKQVESTSSASRIEGEQSRTVSANPDLLAKQDLLAKPGLWGSN
eukprot:TRINITY_DN12490_c0_g3_i1.p1 TRINITY_DN12490_c0_g3~~TRINITY_DN12490_c0_g3_i1.p1  ORF type:complete len:660 (+),score=103.19 TRINITY_DN12490_c0_g3_i1:85-2064(+)